MDFSLEKSDIDFGYTAVDNLFIEDYLPVADGDFVRIYLYTYKNLLQGENISDQIISRNLNLNITDVKRAWQYWEREGLIEIKEAIDGASMIEFKNLKKLYVESIKDVTLPKAKRRESLLETFSTNDSIREMFGSVDYYIRRQTTPIEKEIILDWITDYNMSPEIIEIAFDYGATITNRLSVNYVKKIILNWYDEKLFSKSEVLEKIEKSDKRYIHKNHVLQTLGLPFRTVSEREIETINQWYDTFDEEIIDEALRRTSGINNPSINYAAAILDRWQRLGINEYSDIELLDKKPESRRNKKRSVHNFEGETATMTEEEINRLAEMTTRR